MPRTDSTGIARHDTRNTQDLAHLVATGMIWRSGPKILRLALDAIAAGDIERPTRNVPPAVDAFLDSSGDGSYRMSRVRIPSPAPLLTRTTVGLRRPRPCRRRYTRGAPRPGAEIGAATFGGGAGRVATSMTTSP